ncbi:hypothetical protein [uncultured Brachyspira sp.]|uniref:hypothetical protein n=1 Tax=uncultured Brachyspira sp. TaxID=221953 RepID=UPI00263692A2|nr:hypothetical protein [uncultured Brachyspira sp.]
MNNKENRLHTSISLSNEEFKKLSEIIVNLNLKNNNQVVSYIVRDYIKKYTDENKQADVNTENNNIIVDNQNNNNISISDLNNSINTLNQTINNLASLINKNSADDIKKGTVN